MPGAGKRPAAGAKKQAAQEQAEAHKADGNAAFQAGAYEEAVRAYTQAAEADPGCAVYWSNRAQAYLKVCPNICNRAVVILSACAQQLSRAPKSVNLHLMKHRLVTDCCCC